MRKDSVKYKAELSTAAFEQVVSEIVSDQFRVESELQTVPKLAGMLASMHWTLIEFPEPLLATCDQPLQAVPFFGAGEGRPVVAVPDSGMSSIQEVRFPIDPSHCLLLSWKEGVDSADVVVGSDWVAAQVNRVTLAQADREWFHLPGRRPTTLTPPDLSDTRCAALGPVVLTNYSVANAFRSPRRAKINQIVNRMIREGDHETIGVIYPEITDKAA